MMVWVMILGVRCLWIREMDCRVWRENWVLNRMIVWFSNVKLFLIFGYGLESCEVVCL